MRKKTLVSLVTLALTTAAVQAQAMGDEWYLSPMLNYAVPDSDRDADEGWGLGVAVGKMLNERWNTELNLTYNGMTPHNIDLYSLGVDALYFFSRNPSFAPYGVVGVGYLQTDMPSDEDDSVMANLGLGFVKQIRDNIDLRADARYRINNNSLGTPDDSTLGDWLLSVGLNIALGAKAAPPPPPAPKAEPVAPPAPVVVAPADSDGDGVTDDKDACPGTPAGAKVNAQGCELDSDGDGVVDRLDQCPDTPAGAKVNAQGCELDSDGDGVVDRLDQCPDTPAGAKVNAQGCELDSDGDGVVDRLDQCADTPAGRKVNAQGCEMDGDGDGIVDALDQCPTTPVGDKVDAKGCTLLNTIILKGVNFDNDADKLRDADLGILDEAVATLKRYPQIKVEIAGHTDSRNSDEYNQNLSERRAKAVLEYFVSKGVPAENLTAKGYGEAQPIADNNTDEGRFQNRRVELRILN